MSDKRKLSTILGICGATVLAGGGSSFLTNTGLSLLDDSRQIELQTDWKEETGETEQPLTVEQFSSTQDAFVISAKKILEQSRGEGDEISASRTDNPDSTTTSGNTMYATGNVNIRGGADADSEVLGVLGVGEGITVTGNENDGWVEVSYNGQTGYISGNYLSGQQGSSSGSSSGGSSSGTSSSGSSSSGENSSGGGASGGTSQSGSSSGGSSQGSSAPAVIPTSGTMYATDGVNVRSGPSSDNRVLGTIDTGESIGVTGGEYNGWIEVAYNGQVGYIYNTYLVWNQSDINQSNNSSNSGAWDSSYYIADIDSRYLSESELDGWSSTDLAYLRNEIFARHGRIFTTQKYIDYFSQKTWYKPTYDPSYFDGNMSSFLNDCEWANLELIEKLEDQRS